MSWSGWLFALAILIVRGKHQLRDPILFAVVLALTIYSGEPDTLAILLLSLAVFVAVLLVVRARRHAAKAIARPVLNFTLGSIAGLGLAAPLLLPAAQLTAESVRGSARHPGVPAYQTLQLVFQTFNGLSFARVQLGHGYVTIAAYIGVIAAVLAVMAAVRRRHQPAVIALVAVALVAGCLAYVPPLVRELNHLPGLGGIRWVRGIQLLDFALAILAGVGLDVVVRSENGRALRRWLGAGFGAVAVLLVLVWTFDRRHLAIRSASLIWPAVEVGIGLIVFIFLEIADGRRGEQAPDRRPWLKDPSRTAGVALLLCSSGFLVALGAPWWSSSSAYLTPTRAEVALQRAVGSSIVGFGNSPCWAPPTLGIQPDVNIVYGVHELDTYDPMAPKALYRSWQDTSGHSPLPTGSNGLPLKISMFCPEVTTVDEARQFGVGFVLEPHGVKGPPGSVFDKRVGREELYRIPATSVATISPLVAHGVLPPVGAAGKPLAVTYPAPASWRVVTHAATPQVLRLRLTDVPGWHASIDGKPLQITSYNRVMLQARIPAGTHTIELHYWPDTFTAGIALAALTLVVIVAVLIIWRWRRIRQSDAASSQG